MSFTRDSISKTPIVDTVFAVVAKAKEAKQKLGDDAVIDATLGSLYTEDGKLAVLDSVYDVYQNLDPAKMAAYASSFTGNADFKEKVLQWMRIPDDLYKEVIATPGGTGAVDISISSTLEAGDSLIVPEIAWTSYSLMASMNGIELAPYSLFEKGAFNMTSFKSVVEEVMKKQKHLTIVINDPCHNPTGYSLTDEEWKEIISFLNECARTHTILIINDVAYIDFSWREEKAKDYLNNFTSMSENMAVVVAFSISKSMTAYGLRCGAAIILSRSEKAVDELKIVFEKQARAIWSNINNGAMNMFVEVLDSNLDAYQEEKKKYVDLLAERAKLFMEQADAAGLKYYPYREGFFITLDMDNDRRDRLYDALMDENIYTVKVNKGIRIAICSLPLAKIDGFPARIVEIEEKLG